MVDVFTLLWSALTSFLRSRVRLEAEILILRQQINVLRRNSPKRFAFRTLDRLVFVGLYRLVPGIVDALAIVRPETVVRWHRAGFRSFWRWRSRRRGGEAERSAGDPAVDSEYERSQPTLGRAPHPRRIAQAWYRGRPDQRCKVHGAEEGRALTGLEILSLQPC